MEGVECDVFHLTVFPLHQSSSLRSPSRNLQVCEYRCRGDKKKSSSVCIYSSPSFFPSFLPSFFFGFLSLCAFALFSQSWSSSACWSALHSSLLCLNRRKKKNRVRWQNMAVDGMNATVYSSQLPLRSRLNSVKLLCLHAPFTVIWKCWMLLPSNIMSYAHSTFVFPNFNSASYETGARVAHRAFNSDILICICFRYDTIECVVWGICCNCNF